MRVEGEAAIVSHGGMQKAVLFQVLGIPTMTRHGYNRLVTALLPREDGWRVEGIYGLEVMQRFVG